MSSLEQKSADVGGPIINKTFRIVTPDVVDLTEFKGAWFTLIPSADMTILLAESAALAGAVDTTTTPVAGDKLVPQPTTGLTLVGGVRFDFRLPTRLGTRGEVFLGVAGAGELQMFISSNIT